MKFSLSFRPHFAFVCLLLFLLCCFLGRWQLQRYDFKKHLRLTYQQRWDRTPIDLLPLQKDLQFLHVKVAGNFLNGLTMLVQNMFHAEKTGYEVLTPFEIPNEKRWLLVDRGWIEHWTSGKTILAAQRIHGTIKLINEYQFILGKNILFPTQWPLVMQKIDIEEIQRLLHHEFFPFIVRLDANQPNGYLRDWTMTNVLPERHLAYAIQWFSFAFVIVMGFICFCYEKK